MFYSKESISVGKILGVQHLRNSSPSVQGADGSEALIYKAVFCWFSTSLSPGRSLWRSKQGVDGRSR
ncbi:hypothetical protein NG799_23905 [Laspinema sp. D1]|uniref:Uncharacterized protein n=1 Tax=Laspinema palackyanum D2a TaxID=2953684 RepID=A0ABT2MX91_9CYAN|nr:hypothetical protein [Laspinema sp. D2a]